MVEVEVYGPSGGAEGSCFSVKTVRNNPAASGVVTGKQTYGSFLSSVLGELSVYSRDDVQRWLLFANAGARDRGRGVHLC